MDKDKRRMIEGWLQKASNYQSAAKEHLGSYTTCSESIQASQECVELSVKSILSLLDIEFDRSHGWKAEQIARIAKQIQKRQLIDRLQAQNLGHIRLPRLLFLANFWAQFYQVTKYGLEAGNLASARDLFDKEDAELALHHAGECYRAASELRYLSEDKLAALASPGGDSTAK